MTTDLDFEPIDPVPCIRCEGDAYLLGALGSLAHFRCRACGWVFSEKVDVELPLQPEED